jgi:hypothetical protein
VVDGSCFVEAARDGVDKFSSAILISQWTMFRDGVPGLYDSAKASCSGESKRCRGMVIRATGTNVDNLSGHSMEASSIGILRGSVCVWSRKSNSTSLSARDIAMDCLSQFAGGEKGIFVL